MRYYRFPFLQGNLRSMLPNQGLNLVSVSVICLNKDPRVGGLGWSKSFDTLSSRKDIVKPVLRAIYCSDVLYVPTFKHRNKVAAQLSN